MAKESDHLLESKVTQGVGMQSLQRLGEGAFRLLNLCHLSFGMSRICLVHGAKPFPRTPNLHVLCLLSSTEGGDLGGFMCPSCCCSPWQLEQAGGPGSLPVAQRAALVGAPGSVR